MSCSKDQSYCFLHSLTNDCIYDRFNKITVGSIILFYQTLLIMDKIGNIMVYRFKPKFDALVVIKDQS